MAKVSLRWAGHALMLSLPLIALGIALPMHRTLAAEPSTAASSDNDNPGYHATESLDSCMRKWDPGTHMSREAWRASCTRIKNERTRAIKQQ